VLSSAGRIETDREAVADAVCSALASALGCPRERVTLDADLQNQLGMDSLAAVEAAITIEERLDIAMPEFATPDELGVRTVGDLVGLVVQKLNAETKEGAQ
jgi:acyl carrier protein